MESILKYVHYHFRRLHGSSESFFLNLTTAKLRAFLREWEKRGRKGKILSEEEEEEEEASEQ